jgi:hypothetical protein
MTAKDQLLHLRVSGDDLKKLRKIAYLTDGNMSEAVRLAIKRFVIVTGPQATTDSDALDVARVRPAYNESMRD